jgi:hypothetical protein
VYSASDVNDTNGTINLLGSSVAYAAGKNKIINGDFGVWQRGTSFSNPLDSTFSADRWKNFHNGTGATRTISQQTFTPGTAPASPYEGTFFLRYAISVAGSGNTYNIFDQNIENVRTFAGQTVTLSFWAKADASRTVAVNFYQAFGSGGSGDVSVTAQNASVTTSWQRFTLTYAIPSVSGKTIGTNSFLALRFTQPGGVTMTLDYWGVQLEQGSTATAFQTATGSIQGELAACQRYYVRSGGTSSSQWMATAGISQSTTKASIAWQLPVTMRVAPTSVEYSSLNVSDLTSYSLAISALVIDAVQTSPFFLTMDITNAATATQHRVAFIRASSTSSYLAASAEL